MGAPAGTAGGAAATARRTRSRRRRALFVAIYLLFSLLLMEGASRAYLRIACRVPLLHPGRMIEFFYPELARARRNRAQPPPGGLRILLLGGSVINPGFGAIGELLAQGIEERTGRRPVIDNLSMPAHTTLDSAIKYRHLETSRYDLVIVYHGINEARANNCPDEMFRNDYSHYSWYRFVNLFERHREARLLAAPFTVHYLWARLQRKLGWVDYVATDVPRRWREHGVRIKTAGAFRANLERILEQAAERGEPVLLMTFAYFLPADYSYERFQGHALDFSYGPKSYPIELWGVAASVVKALVAHNEIVRELAAGRPAVRLVDQARLLPREGRLFNDVCHLSDAGQRAFVANIVAELKLAR